MPLDRVKKVRKGTKSCRECRVRKLRCIRSPPNAQSCRRCEERGSACLAQRAESPVAGVIDGPSEDRFRRLELQVSNLTRTVESLHPSREHPGLISPRPLRQSPDRASPGSNFSDSDILPADQPSHLHSLFQNRWVSLSTHDGSQHAPTSASSNSQEAIRLELQRLVPPDDEIKDFVSSATEWLSILYDLLPQPFTVRSGRDLHETAERMRRSDTDLLDLSGWLLSLAITAIQAPLIHEVNSNQSRKHERRTQLAERVSYIIQHSVLSQSRLISTKQGIVVSMHFVRLQLVQGHFIKAWLWLRHTIAIAELIGLPAFSRSAGRTSQLAGIDQEDRASKVQLWDLLCSTDKLLGMMINVSPSISPTQLTSIPVITMEGLVQARLYFAELVNIAGQIQYLDELNLQDGQLQELQAMTAQLSHLLAALSSEAPQSWWIKSTSEIQADHIVQFLHYYITFRVHLPLATRQDADDQFASDRCACWAAGESVIQRYQILVRALPLGFILSTLLDLQTFAAAACLLIMCQITPTSTRQSFHFDQVRIKNEVRQVITLMRQRFNANPDSRLAQKGFHTIATLERLLQGEETLSGREPFNLEIPLLGKISICQISSAEAPARTSIHEELQPRADLLWQIPNGSSSADGISSSAPYKDLQNTWNWNNLTWSIEPEQSNYFQEAFYTDNREF